MLTIGDFARHGRVSVRMLRHYDALGLLAPARVDAATGYRYYTADQLARLNWIVALKDLGLSLAQIRAVLDDQLTAEQLRGMLRLRHAQLRQQIEADTARLAGVEARLAMIEREGHLPTAEIVVKSLPAFEVVDLPAVAAAATLVHHGPMAESDPSFQALGRWIGDNGYRSTSYRELYLSCPGPDQSDWVTELQEPVVPA
jgi:DNA-binding transcriptional MerR regulator